MVEDSTPDHVTFSNSLLAAQYEPDATAAKLFTLHREWDAAFAQQPRLHLRNTPGPGDIDRRLRIGFVSGDFEDHPVGYLTVRAIESLDPHELEVFIYSDSEIDHPISQRVRQAAAYWRDCAAWPDDRLIWRIDRDRIDILVDLAGHTGRNRMTVFARKAAPLQITWAGYPGTTGLSAIDALIADRHLVPAGEDDCYIEQVIRMPAGFVCYDPPADAPAISTLPAGDDRPLTFGSFHNPVKINAGVVRLWSRVMEEQPGSCIRFLYGGYNRPELQDRTRDMFAREGIGAERLGFMGNLPRPSYFQEFGKIDLMLDPFPFSGGMITCDALWMGVPVVTLPGRTFAGRQSQSHLSAIGLPELIAATEDEYLAIIRSLGADRQRLGRLRADLRGLVAASPLCDGKQFARAFETALRALWRQRLCSGAG
jgi:predicted O-linked N-acetylglucosamine transferase (SPINDLY family)